MDGSLGALLYHYKLYEVNKHSWQRAFIPRAFSEALAKLVHESADHVTAKVVATAIVG
jgi:hypothetical protein